MVDLQDSWSSEDNFDFDLVELNKKLPSNTIILDNYNKEINSSDDLIRDFMNMKLTKIEEISYIQFSIFLFFEKFLNTSLVLFNRNYLSKLNKTYISFINNTYLSLLKMYRKIAKKFNLYNFLTILFCSLYFKDMVILKNFLIKRFNTNNFKRHKRILSMLRHVFKIIVSFLMGRRIILGFKFSIAGKIGLAGSSKKKKWTFKKGSINLSSKIKKLKMEYFQFWTTTGCLGAKLYLSFK